MILDEHTYYLRRIKSESLYAVWLDQLSFNASARMTPSYARIFKYFRTHSKYYGNSDVLRNLRKLHLVYRTKHRHQRYYELTNRGRYLYKDGVFDHVPHWHIDPKAPRTLTKNRMRTVTRYHKKSLMDRIIFSVCMLIMIAALLLVAGLSDLGIIASWCLLMATIFQDIDNEHSNPLIYSSYQRDIYYKTYIDNVPYLESMLDRDIGLHISEALFMNRLLSFNYFKATHNFIHKDPYCSLNQWSDRNRWRVGSFHKMFDMYAK